MAGVEPMYPPMVEVLGLSTFDCQITSRSTWAGSNASFEINITCATARTLPFPNLTANDRLLPERTHAPVEASSGRCGAAALDELESDRWQVASKRIMSGTGGYPTGRSDHRATRTFLHGA